MIAHSQTHTCVMRRLQASCACLLASALRAARCRYATNLARLWHVHHSTNARTMVLMAATLCRHGWPTMAHTVRQTLTVQALMAGVSWVHPSPRLVCVCVYLCMYMLVCVLAQILMFQVV